MAFQRDVQSDKLTDNILERAVAVHREMGPNHREKTYRDALEYALEEDDFEVESEVGFPIRFREHEVARGCADLVVEEEVVLELKVVRRMIEEHFQQLARNVRNHGATRGLLINFGQATLEVRRYVDGYEPNGG